MSEISQLKESVDELKTVVLTHIAETNAYRKEKDKVVDALASSYWDKPGSTGTATKVDRLNEIEKNRKWFLRAVYGATIGLIVEKLARLKMGG